jgi:hypothetical protein
MTTVQYVAAAGFSLLLFVLVGNLLVGLYQRAAVRGALDEGVHAALASPTPVRECDARVRAVVGAVARGSTLRVDALRCTAEARAVTAEATVAIRSWLPVVPDWRLSLRASAQRGA